MGARRRVLWLIKGLGPGGAERLLVSFAEASDAADLDYACAYVRSDRGQLVPELRAAGVTVHSLAGALWPWRLRRLVRAERFDVVHSHSPLMAAVARVMLRTAPRSWRPALVSTEHNVPEAYHPLTKLANDLTFGLDDVHLAVSQEAVRSAPQRHRGTVEVVVHGVGLAAVRQAADRAGVREELSIDPDCIVIGTIANYRVHKAWPDLLAAARLVIDEVPGVRFVGVGQGPLERDVRAAHDRRDLGERFILLGHRPDAVRVLSACDIFVLASVQEGLPVALMEALALGVPVVATSVGGVPEAITDGVEGRLVAPGIPALLAEALVSVAMNADMRCQMAVAAASRGEMFDIGRAVQRTESIYRHLPVVR